MAAVAAAMPSSGRTNNGSIMSGATSATAASASGARLLTSGLRVLKTHARTAGCDGSCDGARKEGTCREGSMTTRPTRRPCARLASTMRVR